MHDSTFLALEIRPIRLDIWHDELDIWHDEPAGADAFTVCGRPPQGRAARLRWTILHARHLHYRFWPYLHIKRWITHRCDGCGRRFGWKEARHSYQGTDKVWHDPCMSLRTVRSQLDDITGYVRGTADWNARWRVEYRLKGIDEKERA